MTHVDHSDYASNARLKPWPTYSDVTTWSAQNNGYGDTLDMPEEQTQFALDAAISRIATRCQLDVYKTETVDGVKSTVEPLEHAEVLPEVWLATVMQAARWAQRNQSTNGVLGSNDAMGAIRVYALDPDIEAMLGDHVRLGLA